MLEYDFNNLSLDFLLLSVVLIATWMLFEYFSIPKNYPPGPWGLPIVGYLPFLGSKAHVTLTDLSKKYGDIYSIRLVKYKSVVLTSYNALNEAFVKKADIFSARPQEMMPLTLRDKGGVIFNNGESWNRFRRFSLTTLRNFGFGKSALEQTIMEEVHQLIDIIQANNGRPMLIGEILMKSVSNVICTLMSGHRMEYDDPIFNELLKLTKEQIESFGFGNIETLLPLPIQKLNIMDRLGFSTSDAPLRKNIAILAKIVEKYAKNHRPGSHENFIDSWLTEIERKGEEAELYKLHDLPFLLRDLFAAGSDTTTNSLFWGFLYMAKFPEIQKKIQNEIDDIIGRDRSPTFADQKNMPFTEATLMEISRIETIVPLSLVHVSTKDSTLGGYSIPKNTIIVPNLYAVNHDPETFPEPHQFKPERFLNDQHQVKKMEQLVPFSIGKRQCMGESLARMEMFLFFTTILQNFTVKKVEGVSLDFDYKYSVVSSPKPQNLCLVPR